MATKKKKSQLVSATYLIPPDMKDRVATEAAEADISAGQYVRKILRDWFGGKQEKAKSQ